MDLSLTIAITYNLGTSLTCAYSVNLWSLSNAVQVSSWPSKPYGPGAVIENLFFIMFFLHSRCKSEISGSPITFHSVLGFCHLASTSGPHWQLMPRCEILSGIGQDHRSKIPELESMRTRVSRLNYSWLPAMEIKELWKGVWKYRKL